MLSLVRDDDPSRAAGLARPRVLLAEADARLAAFLDRALAADGYQVERITDGMAALEVLERGEPDVLMIDVGLPGVSGLALARQLRARTRAPIIILSNLDSLEQRVAALDAGGDDYLAIPFAVEELLARLRALRRGRALAWAGARSRARQGRLTYAELSLDLDAREARRGARKLELRNKGYELLAYFMRHPERVLSRRELLVEVWGYDFLGDSNVIEVTVSHLRQALEAEGEPRLIHTVRPIGYILNARGAQGMTTS